MLPSEVRQKSPLRSCTFIDQTTVAASLARQGTEFFAPALLAGRRRHGASEASDIALVTLRPSSVVSRSFQSSALRPAEPSSSRQSPSSATTADDEKNAVAKADKKGTWMQRAWATVKHEASHYWHGTKLLGKEIRLSAKYQVKLLRGKKLTRRERRQVRRMSAQSRSHDLR